MIVFGWSYLRVGFYKFQASLHIFSYNLGLNVCKVARGSKINKMVSHKDKLYEICMDHAICMIYES